MKKAAISHLFLRRAIRIEKSTLHHSILLKQPDPDSQIIGATDLEGFITKIGGRQEKYDIIKDFLDNYIQSPGEFLKNYLEHKDITLDDCISENDVKRLGGLESCT